MTLLNSIELLTTGDKLLSNHGKHHLDITHQPQKYASTTILISIS